MNLHQIELFIAIAETGSFSRAAEAALLNQSTVSQHISALEEEMGSSLLDRTSRGALLSASGKVFLRHARRILSERESLMQAMQSFRGLSDAQLKIGASNIPANYLVPGILPLLISKHPGIRPEIQTGDSREMVDRLLEDEIELALIGSRVADKGVQLTPLVQDRLVLVVGPNHPWQKKKSITLTDLADQPFVVREGGSGSGQTLDQAFCEHGLAAGSLRVVARLGSNEAVLQGVKAGLGCAFVSELAIGQQSGNRGLHQITVQDFEVERQLWLARLKDRSLSPAGEAFCEVLFEHIGN